jgi:hypothetical protein
MTPKTTRKMWGISAVVCMAAWLAAPSLLTSAEDHEGWYLLLETASSTPGNVNTPVLATSPSTGSFFGSSSVEFGTEYTDFDSDVDFTAGFGYSWGKAGRLQVTYWSYSDETDAAGFSYYYPNFNWMTIGPFPSVGNGSSYYAYTSAYSDLSFDMRQELEASQVDVQFSRPFDTGSDRLEIDWGVGFRYASFEDKVSGVYVIDPLGFAGRAPVSRVVDSEGFGLTGSVGARYLFGDGSLGVSSNLTLGFLMADVDSSQSFTDLDGFTTPGGVTFSQSNSAEDEVANTVDFDASFLIRAGERADFELGWYYRTWTDLAQPGLSRVGSCSVCFGSEAPSDLGDERERISWSGPRLRFKYRF